MQALRDILDGKRTETLSPAEIRRIVQDAGSCKNLLDRSRIHLYITKGLSRGAISPDQLLPIAISEVKAYTDLTMVAIALRMGGNRNLYINTPGIGPAHIIVYTVVTLKADSRDINLIMSVCFVLMIMGSQSVSPSFDQSGNRVRDEAPLAVEPTMDLNFMEGVSHILSPNGELPTPDPVIGTVADKPYQSVQQWLQSQGLPSLNSLPKLLAGLKKSTRTILGIICDRTDIANADDDGTSINLDDVLVSRSLNIVNSFRIIKGLRIGNLEKGEFVGLIKSVDAGCSESFIHFIDAGLTATYFTINRLVIQLRKSFRDGNTVLTYELQRMIQYAVSKGSNIDMEQLAIISTTSDAIASSILRVYREPAWRKVCAGDKGGSIPDSLKSLAFNLNIESVGTKDNLCRELENYSEADPESLKSATILRQKARIGAAVSTISDFVVGTTPNVSCQNKTVLQADPFEYGDASMSYYRDGQGAVWCFLSNMYESLLKNPVNPHTTQPLPVGFQNQIRSHLDILQRLGISPSNPVTVASAIDDLSKKDEVSGKESEFIVNTILQTSTVAGIDPARIKSLDPSQMNQILSTIGMDQDVLMYITPDRQAVMTSQHQLITFCRAAYHMIKEHPEQGRVFFNSVKMISTA